MPSSSKFHVMATRFLIASLLPPVASANLLGVHCPLGCPSVGPDNDDAIQSAAYQCGRIVCAWGNHGGLRKRSGLVLSLLRTAAGTGSIMALHVTKQDQPGHPLYLASDTEPFLWDERDRPVAR